MYAVFDRVLLFKVFELLGSSSRCVEWLLAILQHVVGIFTVEAAGDFQGAYLLTSRVLPA